MRSGATVILLQLDFHYRFSRAISERLKRKCFILFAYLTSPKSTHRVLSQHITRIYSSYALQRHKNYLKSRWMNWGPGEQCIARASPRKQFDTWLRRTIQELCFINPAAYRLYAADSPTVHPLDFIVLSEAAAVPCSAEIGKQQSLCKLSKIVCVKADCNDSHQLFIIACLQENASVSMKRVKVKVFIQDPFNPVLFTEDEERYVNVSNIVCALTCYNYREDILEL